MTGLLNQLIYFVSFFITKVDENPSIGHKTLIVLPLNHNYTENKSENIWSANIDKSDGNSITVLVSKENISNL